MDAKQLAEIKAREQAATPGPWKVGISALITDANGHALFFGEDAKGNADFIAHARTDIPALISEVERLNVIAEQRYQLYDGALTTIATLEKALGLACERIAEYAFCGGTDAMKQKHAKKNIQHFIQQAQEQEADHA